jgi:hypothetical protein
MLVDDATRFPSVLTAIALGLVFLGIAGSAAPARAERLQHCIGDICATITRRDGQAQTRVRIYPNMDIVHGDSTHMNLRMGALGASQRELANDNEGFTIAVRAGSAYTFAAQNCYRGRGVLGSSRCGAWRSFTYRVRKL